MAGRFGFMARKMVFRKHQPMRLIFMCFLSLNRKQGDVQLSTRLFKEICKVASLREGEASAAPNV
jgi:hypothetical protein